jgi:type I restriction-modification system DNA methylase subunit
MFLKADGFLAIVIPDGVLTNSTLQYARDWIAQHFRIVAIVSMPQTAFTATGAGVKSSVMFLRKYNNTTIRTPSGITIAKNPSAFKNIKHCSINKTSVLWFGLCTRLELGSNQLISLWNKL